MAFFGWITLVTPDAAAAERVVAYVVPAGTAGNQEFSGVLGMDFEVANPIIVTQIGVFDDNSDGLRRPITAKIYDRSDPVAPVALVTVEFTPEEPGTLIGGSRFKPLAEPLKLGLGFQGTITAENYGAEERLRNTLGNLANRNWSVNDGNGSLVFVGTSRYGTVNGEYADVADGGPADRYCAGTFEFETTPPLQPGPATGVEIRPGNGTIGLSWQAVTNPLPAAKYEILRATSRTADFAKVGETATPQYEETGLANGQVYCYRVRGIGAGGQVGVDSPTVCAAAYDLTAGQNIAYRVKAGTAGGQAFDGVLGMDFEVANEVIVTHLGVFDDGSDGLGRTITARLWDRSDPDAPTEVASLDFSAEDPGILVDGSRFKALPTPVRLAAGFKGTISAENYGAEERLNNPGGNPQVVRPWTLESGTGSLSFTGTGRFGTVAGEFPATPDAGAPDRYGAGTFQYQTTALVNPGIPQVTLRRGDRSVILSWNAVTEPAVAATYRILRRVGEAPLAPVGEVSALDFTDANLTKGTEYCYAVVGVSATGQAGVPSNVGCLVAEAREPGVAYVIAAGTVGEQAFGGALGMEFDVLRPVRVTRLGVFDDGSDGLFLTISARLYDRSSQQVVAELTFLPEDAGELIDGSRFKTLSQAVMLPAGFQGTIVASGYGGDERNGNVGGIASRSVFTGGGSLAFVGLARYGVDPAGYPNVPDGGPANRYGAGTFFFEPAAEQPVMTITRSGARLSIAWSGGGTLQTASSPRGSWSAVPGATSGFLVEPTAAAAYYRVQQ